MILSGIQARIGVLCCGLPRNALASPVHFVVYVESGLGICKRVLLEAKERLLCGSVLEF